MAPVQPDPSRARLDRAAVAAMIDHTLLAPEATPERVLALCDEAVELGVAAVCVSPRWVRLAAGRLDGQEVRVATVVGFPSGAHRSDVKADEARAARADGADEIDMVVALGDVVAREWDAVRADIAAVRDACASPTLLKVIVESALLDDERLDTVCRTAVDLGADHVKTSTGFHPAGGATVEAVRRMRAVIGPVVGLKASGGIRDAATALAMIEAGATRIGASSTAAIIDGL